MADSPNRPPAGAPRADGEAPRTRFGAGAQGARPGGREEGGTGGRGGPRGRRPGGGRYVPRRKVCGFCVDNIGEVDYKDIARLRRHLSERGKIEPRRKLGTCATHQRSLTTAIKRARHVALLPFTTSVR
ncbi:MAG: SSU ribosomal protein S18p @ SSU ribosomal protein S18p, zinc-dependent [uncultured Thermomicrobiales bacterium]|uniref:Small ribosomal subunit protein bS18 n=1 Tax=uncultured Thermomicrobiales bacterium TaxID=1645740 RepID=A0A6J4VUL9_9BACT|nr:MAG: SSU ribosomal protein S18p @ SSU ribosomal protein S18p, zinc-dependent [uncultured Thermomicrobiales bacterium]